jgi:hypothetical protein
MGISSASPRRRVGKLLLDAVDEKDHGPFEALGLVHGEHVDGRRVRVCLGHRGVIPRVDEGVEVIHELPHVVVLEDARGVTDAREELADVLHLLLLLGGRLGVPGHEAGIHEKLVEQLARRRLAGQLHVALEVGHEPPDGPRSFFSHLHVRGHVPQHVKSQRCLRSA